MVSRFHTVVPDCQARDPAVRPVVGCLADALWDKSGRKQQTGRRGNVREEQYVQYHHLARSTSDVADVISRSLLVQESKTQ